MNKRIWAYAITLVLIVSAFQQGWSSPKREHRAVWCSAFVADWPSNPISEGNAEVHKKIGRKMLDSLAVNNFTTVYYHVRAMCDAMYDSKYEPWSSYVSETRGVAPVFDPLAFMIEEGHKRGIEVYAWFNPYRYSPSSSNKWGGSDRDYLNTHPEWLMESEGETILNPALPEVEQRIVDVVNDVITKYDVDGVVFDDYFYPQKGTIEGSDAAQYDSYVKGGGKLSIADWRRENVNMMVRKVNTMIKTVKPWVRFGISPAGVAGTANTSAPKYNIKPSPGSDWQYNTIYSDPLAWLNEGTIDFISPQVYWPISSSPGYANIAAWWSYAVKHFNRHLFVSQTLSDFADKTFSDYSDEINVTRNETLDASPGTVYFKSSQLLNAAKVENRKARTLMNYLKGNLFTTKSLNPMPTWIGGNLSPVIPSDVKLNEATLSWNGEDNVRFVVYAIPVSMDINDFNRQPEYIVAISYFKEFVLPDAYKDGFKYAVSTLDRYGNESSAIFVGAQAVAAPVVTLQSPASETSFTGMCRFAWESTAKIFDFEIASDPEMKNIIYHTETENKYILSNVTPDLKDGVKYFWRVISKASNSNNYASEVRSFTINYFRVSSPINEEVAVSINPTITWNSIEGASYKISVARDANMENKEFTSQELNSTSFTIPKYTLYYGTKYYVQVEATVGQDKFLSIVSSFVTVDVVPTPPVLISPTQNGEKLFSNSKVWIKPQEGIYRSRIEISSSTSFPVRSSYFKNLDNFVFEGDEMGTVKVNGSNLVSGNTYYLRVRHEYFSSTTTSMLYTDYSPAPYISFVYDSGTGIEGVNKDTEAYLIQGNDAKLIIPNLKTSLNVDIFNSAGIKVKNIEINAEAGYTAISLSMLEEGVYLVNVNCNGTTATLKLIK